MLLLYRRQSACSDRSDGVPDMTCSLIRLIAAASLMTVVVGATAGSSLAAETAVDLELVLAIDVSGSVDETEARLQRDGYVQALRHKEVIDAISGGFLRRIAVTYLEWAGEETQTTVVDWRLVDGEKSAIALSAEIAAAPIARGRYTSISQAIRYSVPKFTGNGYEGTRRVIDISGDGANNTGGLVNIARDEAVALGITINGLPIVNNRPNRFGQQLPDLDLYYRDCVIGGSGAFLVVARDFEAFARAVRKKLVLEIAALPEPRMAPSSAPGNAPGNAPRLSAPLRKASNDAPPCDAGERRLRRMFLDP